MAFKGSEPPFWYGGPKWYGVSRGSQMARKGGSNSGPTGKRANRWRPKGTKKFSSVPADLKKPWGNGFVIPRSKI